VAGCAGAAIAAEGSLSKRNRPLLPCPAASSAIVIALRGKLLIATVRTVAESKFNIGFHRAFHFWKSQQEFGL
jgi:hypothetical protein